MQMTSNVNYTDKDMGPNTPEDDNKQYENISDNEMSHEILRMVCVFFVCFKVYFVHFIFII